jgi:hypothetical protein
MRLADNAVADYYMDDYASAQSLLEPLARTTDENFVLNNARLGSVALARYDLNVAEDAFLRAYEVINSVGVNNGRKHQSMEGRAVRAGDGQFLPRPDLLHAARLQ